MKQRHGKRLYLHIGRHKCGTSTLQHFLCASDAALAENGLLYPKTLRSPVAHHPLAHLHHPRPGRPEDAGADAKAAIAAFWREVDPAERVIISSEAFQNVDPARLVGLFAGFDLTVIVYLREPLDYLLSAYAQKVKGGGGTEMLMEFIDRFQPDYRQFLQSWREAFPAADLKVRAFERGHLLGADIRRDFLACLGITGEQAAAFDYPEADSNVSIGGDLLEFMRRVNLQARPGGSVRHGLYRACQDLALRHPAYRERPALPLTLQQAIRARHADSLAWVVKEFFGGVSPFSEKSFPEGEAAHRLSSAACDLVWQRLEECDGAIAKALKSGPLGAVSLHD